MYSYNKNGINIKDNKFVFGGVNLSNDVVVESVIRPLLPPIQNEGVFIEGRAGQVLKRSVVSNNLITVKLRIIEDKKEEREKVVKKLATSLYSPNPQKLELNDTDLYNYAIISNSTEMFNNVGTKEIEITFECHDPYNYGDRKTVPINSTFNNVGNDTIAKITCITNATDLIQIKQRGKTMMTINHNINAGVELVIDLEKQHITLNGSSIMKYLSLDSDFFLIDKGTNKIEVTNVSSGSTEYQERWL